MTPDEAKELAKKYAALADLFAAKAAGKSLQLSWTQISCGNGITKWATTEYFPTTDSDLSRWRIKPEPRRMWTTADSSGVGQTTNPEDAQEWRGQGYTVTEWQEVQP